jgi:hypothetical protein
MHSQSAYGSCNITGYLNFTSTASVPTSSTATTTKTSSATTTIIFSTSPGPTQTGIAANCNAWVLQTPGLFCADLATEAGISLSLFYTLNPAVNNAQGDCQGLLAGDAYCVGTTTTSSSITSSTAASAGTKAGTAPPAPTQAGVPADCKSWEKNAFRDVNGRANSDNTR